MVIGSLAVNIVANIEKFGQNLSKGQTLMRTFTRAITPLRAAVAGLALAMTSQFSIGGLVQAAEQIDVIAKASDRLNISTERLIGLGHAADLSGVSLDSLTKAMTFMHKTVGDDKASSALSRLNLNVGELRRMSADQMFLTIANAINKLGDESQQTNIAMELFGRSGAEMLPLIQEGEVAIRGMMREADTLGMTLSRLDAAKVEEMNDAVTRLKGAWAGLARELTISVAPAMEESANILTTMLGILRGTDPVSQFKKTMKDPLGTLANRGRSAAPPAAPPGVVAANNRLNPQNELFKFGIQKQIEDALKQGAFGVGKLIGGATNLPGQAAAGLGRLLASATKNMGTTPGFALTQAGSAESFRQRAAISRQNDTMKVAKEGVKEQKKTNDWLGQIANKLAPLAPANF